MTMTGPNSVMSDEIHPERIVDETLSPEGMSPLQEAAQAIRNLLFPVHEELIRMIRVPTPQKVTKTFTADATGNIAGGLTNPVPQIVYTCPLSVEGWVHRMAISSPGNGPANPLKTGEIVFYGSQSNETMQFLPQNGIVAPVIITEGRASAPHLNAGESMWIVGDTLPAGQVIRVDLQVLLIAPGTSVFTPNDRTPNVPLASRMGIFE